MNAISLTREACAPSVSRAQVERHELRVAGALFLSVILAAVGVATALLLGARWWSVGVALAILAIAPIAVLMLTSRKD